MAKKKKKIEEPIIEDIDIDNIDNSFIDDDFSEVDETAKENIDNSIIEEDKTSKFKFELPEKPVKSEEEQRRFDSTLFVNYIGKNYRKIMKEKYSFPAFFFNGLYLVYRKMYLLGILIFALQLTLFAFFLDNIMALIVIFTINLIMSILIGEFINKKYAEKAYNDCMYINEKYGYISDDAIVRLCKKKGGTSFVSVIITILSISSIVIPSVVIFKPIIYNNQIKDTTNIETQNPATTTNIAVPQTTDVNINNEVNQQNIINETKNDQINNSTVDNTTNINNQIVPNA